MRSQESLLTQSKRWQTVGYLGFLSLFVGELAVSSLHWHGIDTITLLLLGFAAFRGGVSISEDEVFCWLRGPFTVTHKDATGAGDSVSPKYTSGLLGSVSGCFACPICMSTHVGSMLITIYTLVPTFGTLLIYALSAACIAELVHSVREANFWSGRHEREQCK